jgi:hypothetical protein
VEVADYPFVAPGLLARAETMCPRRLRRDFDGLERERAPGARYRVRERLVDAARQAHAVARPPALTSFPTPVDLIPEEAAVFERAAAGYIELFGTVAANVVAHGCDEPTVHHGRQLVIGGFIDLLLEAADGSLLLRQLNVSGYPVDRPPLDEPAVRVALLRLARVIGDRPITVELADLIGPTVSRAAIRVDAELDELRAWFDDRIAIIQQRAATPIAIAGGECGNCRHVAGCPAHR